MVHGLAPQRSGEASDGRQRQEEKPYTPAECGTAPRMEAKFRRASQDYAELAQSNDYYAQEASAAGWARGLAGPGSAFEASLRREGNSNSSLPSGSRGAGQRI